MSNSIEKIRESFEVNPYFSHLGFKIIYFHEGDVLLKLSITRELLNGNHTLHGGVHASMLDLIMGMVIRSKTKTRCITINLNINYLAPIYDGEVFAKGKILQQGHRTVTVEGELYNENKNILTKGAGVYKLIREK